MHAGGRATPFAGYEALITHPSIQGRPFHRPSWSLTIPDKQPPILHLSKDKHKTDQPLVLPSSRLRAAAGQRCIAHTRGQAEASAKYKLGSSAALISAWIGLV